jgi:hypothetical protein
MAFFAMSANCMFASPPEDNPDRPNIIIVMADDRASLMEARLKRLVDSGLIPEGTTLHDSALNAKPVAAGVLATERMAIHAAMVESIDRSLADTMVALEKAGKLDNTLILVLSDNGASHQAGRDRKAPPGVRPGSMDTFLTGELSEYVVTAVGKRSDKIQITHPLILVVLTLGFACESAHQFFA